jgi:signal transduction histidine kinase
MHPSIRLQLLFPLVPLVLGLAATTAWTAWSAAAAAREQIRAEMDHIAAAVRRVTIPFNAQTVGLMKDLTGAELLIIEKPDAANPERRQEPLSTLTRIPPSLPDPDDNSPSRIVIGDAAYLSRGIRLTRDEVYVFYPEALLDDAIWRAVRPALIVGVAGGIASIFLAALITQHLTRRIVDLQRRTRLIAAGDFSPMPLPNMRDELRDLGRSINEMAEQLSRFQETLRTTERLRLLGQVSGGLAHQLRNGVAGARLALQVHAREKSADESIQVALRQLALVETYLKRFLDLGRTVELRPEPIDLAALLDETMLLLQPQCRHANIDLRRGGDWPISRIHADPGQIRQVLLNVISNAVEAAGPGGTVEVVLRREGERHLVEVFDTGRGVPEQVAAKLFEPFVTGKPEGVGLGLAVSRQIIEAHGGTIDWSHVGERTCFRITLPDRPVGGRK